MKFIVDYAALRPALQLCASIINKNAVVNIIATDVRIEANGETLTVAATDLEVTAICIVPAIVVEEGACSISASALTDIAKSATESIIAKLNPDNMRLAVTCGTASYDLPAIGADFYPAMPEMDDAQRVEISASEFLPMMRTVTYAMLRENEQRFSARGVFVKLTKRAMEMCAIDGQRIALVALPRKSTEEAAVLLPPKLVRAADKLTVTKEATDVELAWNDNHASVSLGAVRLIGRREEIRFPAYDQMIPKEESDATMLLVTEDAAAALDRVSAFAIETTRCVKLHVTRGRAEIAARGSNAGACVDGCAVDYSGPDEIIGISGRHLADALKAVTTKTATVQFGKEMLTVRPVESALPFSAVHCVAKMVLNEKVWAE